MSPPLLLDTCALIWVLNGDKLRSEAEAALQTAATIPGQIVVSPISAWEVGQLVSKGRLRLAVDPLSWFQMAADGGMSLASLTPSVLVAASFLPGTLLRDPADRIIAATARAHGYRLMTRDKPLLGFAAEGHVQAIAC
ncbi:MAG TPA: type II toxin-antitoxin system VapC family toxin [Phenylobacterium sp.]|jgi:PIN domain nuclease of toxin-antitoxin system|uniref:type II toxin-antitoxin system VapC family toxin n=1 Tax=Phenylobacterium sp. TaxID=1871053 RepID=UPI002D6A8123|nr:type II toxin-antitoxin system VapC family toxin [Phenylobacterium sp.]HZZ70496.1 type II toxin-antitoxin system VapC family toxin [Phenylobacterium sp.]